MNALNMACKSLGKVRYSLCSAKMYFRLMCKNEPEGKRLQMIDKEGNELPIIDKNCDLNFNAVP